MKEEKISKLRKAAYKSDASRIKGKPAEVILPENVEEIRDKILFSREIIVRGGGSGLAGINVDDCVLIDLSKMNKILELNENKKEITVEAGLILDDLNNFLEKYGLEFPIQPLSGSICTIGGMIATNASGFRELKYGRTSNFVSEVELINGRGEIVKIGRADLSDVAGQEGITGIITKSRLKLIHKPNRSASLYGAEDIEKVVDIVKNLRLVENISMVFFLDKLASSILGLNDEYHIIAEFESESG